MLSDRTRVIVVGDIHRENRHDRGTWNDHVHRHCPPKRSTVTSVDLDDRLDLHDHQHLRIDLDVHSDLALSW